MMLLRMAVRNVLATPVRTLIIGLLVVFGTTLVVVGGSLLSALDRSMARSVVGSVSGHLQVWSDQARDNVDLFNAPVGTPDLGRIEDFHALKEQLVTVPGVEAVIPMGTDFATVFSGNMLDVKTAELRTALETGDAPREAVLSEHIRSMIQLLKDSGHNLKGFSRVEQLTDDAIVRPGDVERALSTEFWATLAASCSAGATEDDLREREADLEFLENKIAPLAMDETMLFLRYIGTDPQVFAKSFDMFEIVDGQMIPPGQRGFLFAKQMYERQVKHPVARRFDQIKERRERGDTIAGTPEVKTLADQLSRLAKEIVLQLDGPARAEVTDALRALLKTDQPDASALVTAFLTVDDASFDARLGFFYDTIAPHLVLYKVRVGDTLTIRSVTRSGYMTAVNVKVYGTYRFKGLEKSMLAGVYNLMDLMTFRDLYGYMTEDRRRELAEIQTASGARQVERAKAEDELFDQKEEAPAEAAAPTGFDEFAGVDMRDGGRRYDHELLNRVYTQDELESGVVIQAALKLDGMDRIPEAKASIEALSKEKGLGLRVADWREVSGLVGKFIGVIWIVLVTAIVIIFLVALVIINNSMVMATLDRTREIGAMRAMGAQKRTIMSLMLLESVVLGFGFGLVGVGLGSSVVLVLGHVGIPAFTDELYFLFAGPRLLPTLAPEHFLVAFGVVFVVTVASVFYPVRLAMAVQPVEAMGKED